MCNHEILNDSGLVASETGNKSTKITTNHRIGIKLTGHFIIMIHDFLPQFLVLKHLLHPLCQRWGNETIHGKQAETFGLNITDKNGIAVN